MGVRRMALDALARMGENSNEKTPATCEVGSSAMRSALFWTWAVIADSRAPAYCEPSSLLKMFRSHRVVPPAATASAHSSTKESASIGSATASSGTVMATASSAGPDPLPYDSASAVPPAGTTLTLTRCAFTSARLGSRTR